MPPLITMGTGGQVTTVTNDGNWNVIDISGQLTGDKSKVKVVLFSILQATLGVSNLMGVRPVGSTIGAQNLAFLHSQYLATPVNHNGSAVEVEQYCNTANTMSLRLMGQLNGHGVISNGASVYPNIALGTKNTWVTQTVSLADSKHSGHIEAVIINKHQTVGGLQMGMRGVGHTADNRQFDNTGYYYRIVPVNSSDQYQTYYTETAKGANSGPIYQAGYILKDYGFVAQDKELNIAPNNGLTGDTWQPSDLTAATSANADYALPFLWRGAGAPDTPIDGIRGQGAVGTQFWNRINSPCSSVIPLDPTTQSAEVLRKPTNDANWYIQGYTEPQAPALELRGEGLSVDNAELKMNG